MARGVKTFYASLGEVFDFHAYQLTEEGDILAIKKFLGLKGHSSSCACQSCLIRGSRMTSAGQANKVYYACLTQPIDPHNPGAPIRQWDASNLPPRMHHSFRLTLDEIRSATTKRHARELEKYHGIRELPALSHINSLDYGRSFSWEWMHLFAENIIPAMIDIWTGRFKGHDARQETYVLSPSIWEDIGRETAAAVPFIPSTFVRKLGNIAQDRASYVAESYTFWFMYIAPHLLKGRLDAKYFNHLQDLVCIMKMTLQFKILHSEINELEKRCIRWVQQYEEYITLFFTCVHKLIPPDYKVLLPL